jgi:hypothetical protein
MGLQREEEGEEEKKKKKRKTFIFCDCCEEAERWESEQISVFAIQIIHNGFLE